MTSEEQLIILKRGVKAWNKWRADNPDIAPNLMGVDLIEAGLGRANLNKANIERADLLAADLNGADLSRANLSRADLSQANLSKAILKGANLTCTNLREADLSNADLRGAYLGRANLSGANLSKAELSETDFRGANLTRANLSRANLSWADLIETYLRGANISEANVGLASLIGSDLSGVDLSKAILNGADLCHTNLCGADLNGADLGGTRLLETILTNLDLSKTEGLETCLHYGPSVIDHRTLQRSDRLPLRFLRGCGLPDKLIDYAPATLNDTFEFGSCFISYASEDQEFAERLYSDLQERGIRCWLSPEETKIGDELSSLIHETIGIPERLLLVVSECSIGRSWFKKELELALDKERREKQTVLLPIRIDNAVIEDRTGWAIDVLGSRYVGDFTSWKHDDAYSVSFESMVKGLKLPRGFVTATKLTPSCQPPVTTFS